MSEFFGQEIQVITISVPVGTMVDYAGDTAPNDWMKCEGQALDKSSYAALHAVLGEKFGSGDGSGAQFNLPDCRDRVTVGKSATRPVGAVGGVESVAHFHANGTMGAPDHLHGMAHYHNVSVGVGASDLNTIGVAAGGQGPVSRYGHGHGTATGGTDWGTKTVSDASDRPLNIVGQMANTDVPVMQPFVVCTKLIKVV